MYHYKAQFDAFCKEFGLNISLSFAMPEGYENAYGTFDFADKTAYINAGLLQDEPDAVKAFYLFHELRHALQYLRPELFDDTVRRSVQYVILYDGTCFRLTDGAYAECRLDGDAEYLKRLYLCQPHETDANDFAYKRVKSMYGDSGDLKETYAFWTPEDPLPEEVYDAVFGIIDQKTKNTAQKENEKKQNTILVTAFEPFGGNTLNPTQLILEQLPDELGGFRIHKVLLPVEFVKCRELAFAAYDEVKPAAVIMLGQAGGREAITPETTAVNVMNAVSPNGGVRPDNAGFAPEREPVVPGGEE